MVHTCLNFLFYVLGFWVCGLGLLDSLFHVLGFWLCGLGLLDSCLLELFVLCLGFVFLAVWFTTCAFMLFHLFVLGFGFVFGFVWSVCSRLLGQCL